MSWLSDAFSYLRRLAMLDNDVAKLAKAVDTMKAELGEHDNRLVRMETIMEMYGHGRPIRPPRLPRS